MVGKASVNKKTKLYAIFHDGSFDGDSGIYCPDDRLPYNGENMRDLRKKFYEKKLKEDWPNLARADKESRNAAMQDIKDQWMIDGAWVVDANAVKAIQAIWDGIQPWGDHSSYICNRAAKVVANALAIKKLGKKPK